jgi:hypothetical protein
MANDDRRAMFVERNQVGDDIEVYTDEARTQVRAQWLVLAAALTVLAGVLVAWAIERAADRVDVVSVARPVPAGTVIQADDLTTTAIAFDEPVVGLAPAASLDALVGRVAVVELRPGTLLSVGMWADGTGLSPDERTVGVGERLGQQRAQRQRDDQDQDQRDEAHAGHEDRALERAGIAGGGAQVVVVDGQRGGHGCPRSGVEDAQAFGRQ